MKTTTNLSTELVLSYEEEGYENRVLSMKEIGSMLTDHGIEHIVNSDSIIAIETFGEDEEDRTDTSNWTLFDMLSFLNY